VTALLAVALVVAAVAFVALMRRGLEADLAAQIDDRLDATVALASSGELPVVLAAAGVESGIVVVVDERGEVLAASPGAADADWVAVVDALSPVPMGQRVSATVDGDAIGTTDGQDYRVVATAVATADGNVTVLSASSLRATDRAVETLIVSMLAGIPLLVAFAGLLSWLAVGRALRPVEVMRGELDAIGPAIDRRITPPNSDDELADLAASLNVLLDRLSVAAARERRFAADASHELRSPLAAARTQLEVGVAYPDVADWPAIAADVLTDIERLEHLSTELLQLARHDGVLRTGPVDLAAVARSVVRSVTVHADGVSVMVNAPAPVWVEGDVALLSSAVRNLVVNAVRHAAGRVEVHVEVDADRAVLSVADDGDGIAPDDRERVFEPFMRLDGARAVDDGGAGLGLSLARQVVERHGGTLRVVDGRAAGATFAVTLPQSPLR
jgi:signal transduction histidine kinase